MNMNLNESDNLEMQTPAEVLVGHNLREIRSKRGLSLRALAELSGLNVNTLSLVENGKSSPSVGTLQQLAQALDVSMTAFFESDQPEKSVVYTPADERPQAVLGSAQMQNLGKDLRGKKVQPFVVRLHPGMGSGDRNIVHTGYEFVYCLEGNIRYEINKQEYFLKQGDSILFEAHQPHCWENKSEQMAQILLVLYPADEREDPGGRHFSLTYLNKEISMKIALITSDGKTINQHFGRAPYYLVVTIEDGKVTQREMREKMGHQHFSGQHTEEAHDHGTAGHGMDADSHRKHAGMAEAISDCTALICGGMGMGAYQSMQRFNIKPVVTDLRDIEEAITAFIDGKLIDHTELLH
jgi:transcriptional regulator with XRE-family HTH domain/predicted Fe-Mo cluster-binding NifX family protein